MFVKLSKCLDERYQIVLVGTNSDIDKNLPENIISIHRTQNQNELADIYSAADLFVNPTREDNYPTVNMESIACGTPVLTFKTGGSPECIDEETGLVAEEKTYQAILGAIETIFENYIFQEADCVKKAKTFDKNVKYQEYLELYCDILDMNKNGNYSE